MLLPESVFSEPGTVFFDSSRRGDPDTRSLLFRSPVNVFVAESTEDIPRLLAELDRAVCRGYYVAGYLAYEAGYAFEGWPPHQTPGSPLAWFGVYDGCQELVPADIEPRLTLPEHTHVAIDEPAFSLERADYARCIRQIKDYIREGDVYQINFTGSFSFTFEGAPFDLYRLLRRRQMVSYGAVIVHDSGSILSYSPELFFEIDDRRLITRPMKGTAGRGRTRQEDESLGDWLVKDEKNRAENVMIVDLLRNDLSRVCEMGSVQVPALYALETYETLFQMTSTVTGRLKKEVSSRALFEALFPGGSITGAPKLRAMEIIEELEGRPRGVYCGSIGFISPYKRAVFNIAIRTLELKQNTGAMGVGSGIVWDSDPDAEYEECILKGKFLRIDEQTRAI